MRRSKDIVVFVHCATCGQANLEVGLTNPHTLRVWCRHCDILIADFAMADPLPLVCDGCGEEH